MISNNFEQDRVVHIDLLEISLEFSDPRLWTTSSIEDFKSKIIFFSQSSLQTSQLRIFFKQNQFVPKVHTEMYSLTDLVANTGGLLGLFMGASILSIIELIYFMTVRVFGHRKIMKNFSKGSQHQKEKDAEAQRK